MGPSVKDGEVPEAMSGWFHSPKPLRRLGPAPGRCRRKSMSKGQKRGNREQKKPKQDKPKMAVAQSALIALHERPTLPTPAKRK
jgi:hypothetical protein